MPASCCQPYLSSAPLGIWQQVPQGDTAPRPPPPTGLPNCPRKLQALLPPGLFSATPHLKQLRLQLFPGLSAQCSKLLDATAWPNARHESITTNDCVLNERASTVHPRNICREQGRVPRIRWVAGVTWQGGNLPPRRSRCVWTRRGEWATAPVRHVHCATSRRGRRSATDDSRTSPPSTASSQGPHHCGPRTQPRGSARSSAHSPARPRTRWTHVQR